MYFCRVVECFDWKPIHAQQTIYMNRGLLKGFKHFTEMIMKI